LLVLSDLIGQDEVVKTLSNMLEGGNLSHAYLFVGPAGLGKMQAATSLASAVLCAQGGCGTCNVCRRIAKAVHPDVQRIEPVGATGYLIDQIRDITYQVSRAPVEAHHKVYILEHADLFNDSSANAFLKTLEEPPANVTFILFAHSLGTIIPTIRSRCQIIRFKPLSPSVMVELLCTRTGCTKDDALSALGACSNVLADAQEHITSIARQNTRSEVVYTYQHLRDFGDREVLAAAKRIMEVAVEGLAEMRRQHETEAIKQADFLSRGALGELEKAQKRQLSAYQHRCMREVFTVFSSVLRDVVCMSVGADGLATNRDVLQDSKRIGVRLAPAEVAICLDAVGRASARTDANVDPQLALEVMLFDIRKVFICHR
jgi:DNA polymerase-3 subunit delta'